MALGERERLWLEAVRRWNRENELVSGWGSPEERRWVVQFAQLLRRQRGLTPLESEEDHDYPPELEFFERARALGMLPRRDGDA